MIQFAQPAFPCPAAGDRPCGRAFHEGVGRLPPGYMMDTPAGRWEGDELGRQAFPPGGAPEFQRPSPDGSARCPHQRHV